MQESTILNRRIRGLKDSLSILETPAAAKCADALIELALFFAKCHQQALIHYEPTSVAQQVLTIMNKLAPRFSFVEDGNPSDAERLAELEKGITSERIDMVAMCQNAAAVASPLSKEFLYLSVITGQAILADLFYHRIAIRSDISSPCNLLNIINTVNHCGEIATKAADMFAAWIVENNNIKKE